MDSGGFWKLLDHALVVAPDLDRRGEWLSGRLALSPAGEIADFADSSLPRSAASTAHRRSGHVPPADMARRTPHL
ncbi:hypothetical protein ACSHWB_38035 [Lentzea sp. HUAS TT2]|uniref:hypothetical protein n=1 Tax=Lentzea sp. HUAS TT2 TaxID=3447454 RepID=UPI003F6E6098